MLIWNIDFPKHPFSLKNISKKLKYKIKAGGEVEVLISDATESATFEHWIL